MKMFLIAMSVCLGLSALCGFGLAYFGALEYLGNGLSFFVGGVIGCVSMFLGINLAFCVDE